jgi:hypothetical protein
MSPGAPRSGSEPIWTPRAAAVLAVAVALGVAAPLAVAATRHRGSPPNRVAIIVEGLPPGVSAQITIARTGRAPQAAKIARRATIALPGAGAYQVLGSPVKVPGGTYFTAAPIVTVIARKEPTAAVTVNYADFIAASTKVLTVPAGDTVLLMDPPHAAGERLILESKDAPPGIKPGAFLASAPVPGEPDGYLVKVGAELPAPPGEIEFGVTPATLPEVFEKAEIEVSSDVGNTSRPLPWTDKIQCGAGPGVDLSINVHAVEREFSFHAEWNHQGRRHWWKRPRDFRSATLTASLGEHLAGTLASAVHASCDGPILARSIGEWKLPPVVVPFPILHFITIRPVVQLDLSGHITVSRQATWMFDQRAAATLVATCKRGARCTAKGSERFWAIRLLRQQEEQGVKIMAELEVTPTLHLHVWGLAGPHASAGGRITLTVAPPSKRRLQGCIDGGIGFEIRPLGIRADVPRLLSACHDFPPRRHRG